MASHGAGFLGRALPRTLVGCGVWLVVLASVTGCQVNARGTGSGDASVPGRDADAGSVLDAEVEDATVPPPDAGPPCSEFREPRVVALLVAGDGLQPEEGNLVLEEPGQLALRVQPYRYGAVLLTGYATALLGDSPAFTDLDGAEPTGQTIAEDLDFSLSISQVPPALGLAGEDAFTVLAEAAILLEAGTHRLTMDVEDRAVVEVDLGAEVARMKRSDAGSQTLDFEVLEEGWYPIRLAWSDTGGPSELSIALSPPSGSDDIVGGERIRANLSAIEGRELWGWDARSVEGDPDGLRLDFEPTSVDYGGGQPSELGLSNDRWTGRWSGRLRFDSGMGELSVDADDTYRVFVDGVFFGGTYGSAAGGLRRQLALPPGYHDVVLELEDDHGSAWVHMLYDGEPIGAAAMRPHTRFGGVAHGRGEMPNLHVDPGTAETVEVDVDGPNDAPAAVEVSLQVDAVDPEDITILVTSPDSRTQSFPLTDGRMLPGTETWAFRAIPPWATMLDDANGRWSIEVQNESDEPILIRTAGVLGHLGGSPMAFPVSGRVTSSVIDLRDDVELSGLLVVGDVPEDTTVDVELRVSRTEAGIRGATFTSVSARGELPSPTVGRYVQARVALGSAGTETPRVQELRLVGRGCRRCERCEAPRSVDGLVALYDFELDRDSRVRDMAPEGPPLDLFVRDMSAVSREGGALRFDSPTIASSAVPGIEIIQACQAADELTVELWLENEDHRQLGPARIATLSEDGDHRNFTVAQDGDRYQARLRTAESNADGQPYLHTASDSTSTALTHVAYTREASGTTRFYLDGVEQDMLLRPGDLSSWHDGHRFALGNELSGGKPWLGTLHLVAVYARALTPGEVLRHFRLGADPP